MKIENLSQLKRALKDRHKFQIIEHRNCPNFIGDVREVNVMQTNGIYSRSALNPHSTLNSQNQGKGSWLDFGEAKEWTFTGDLCSFAGVWTIKVLDEKSV